MITRCAPLFNMLALEALNHYFSPMRIRFLPRTRRGSVESKSISHHNPSRSRSITTSLELNRVLRSSPPANHEAHLPLSQGLPDRRQSPLAPFLRQRQLHKISRAGHDGYDFQPTWNTNAVMSAAGPIESLIRPALRNAFLIHNSRNL